MKNLSPGYPGILGFVALSPILFTGILGLGGGCALTQKQSADARLFPPHPEFPPEHRFSLDDLVLLSVHRNASLDVARYEAEAAQGLVDQVKALWLPQLRFDFAAIAYDNNLNYEARAFDLATLNVPITGTYNFVNSLAFSQILYTGGKRTSGLKQAKMYAEIKRLDVLRQQDAVAFDVANYYHLVCFTNEVDAILEDAVRRLRVFRQVAENLTQRGSLRSSNVDRLQADYFIAQLEQFRVLVQAGRQQAYEALKHFVGVSRDEPLSLKVASLPPALTATEMISAYNEVVEGFSQRPEAKQLDLFTEIRREQVKFAKVAWNPNVVILGSYLDSQGSNNTILGAIDGLLASLIVDVPIYDAGRLGKLREALGFENASLAFQRQFEELITLQIEVTAIDTQKALATEMKAARARAAAMEHYDATRQAYSRELLPASAVATAIGLDMLAKIQHAQSLYAYHDARARLKRVTADREAQYGY
ncbi:MAG: TolC family protein [Planctomycetota bacterium]